MMTAAIEILVERKISELPVVDDQRRPLGLIDITDVVGLLPHDTVMGGTDSSTETASGVESAAVILPLPNRASEST